MATFRVNREKTLKPVMNGLPLSPNSALMANYRKKLKAITKRMTDETTRKVLDFYSKGFVQDYFETEEEKGETQSIALDEKTPSSQFRIMIAEIRLKYEKLFDSKGADYAEKMVLESNSINKKSVESSFKFLSGGLNIFTPTANDSITETLKASIQENVSLISNITQDYYTKVEGAVARSISQGGAFDIAEQLNNIDGITKRRAKNIANDQTRKVYNNLNKDRMQSAGLNRFKWKHSNAGQKPRPDHVAMNDNIYSFDDLPVIDQRTGETGIPGQAINCRCYMVPVIDLSPEEQEELENAA